MPRVFLDTNVLLYADDADAEDKQEKARAVIRAALVERSGVLSTQVLSEYFVNATRKLGIEPAAARRRIEVLRTLDIVRIEVEMVLAAIDLHRLRGFSLWDCLIVEAAVAGGCASILTEDLQPGQTVQGVAIVDPFAS